MRVVESTNNIIPIIISTIGSLCIAVMAPLIGLITFPILFLVIKKGMSDSIEENAKLYTIHSIETDVDGGKMGRTVIIESKTIGSNGALFNLPMTKKRIIIYNPGETP